MTVSDDASIGPTAIVVVIGTELLTGHQLDTNSAWLARVLLRLNIRLIAKITIGDVPKDIVQVTRECMARSPSYLFVTGGLGPTTDDRTIAAFAQAINKRLHYDRRLGSELQSLIMAKNRLGYAPTALNSYLKMAMVPDEVLVLPNPWGMAPGLAYEWQQGKYCILLPGMPDEFASLVRHVVIPWFIRGPFLSKSHLPEPQRGKDVDVR